MSKRQRVLRACDPCRRGKIKCDGRRPCTHCVVFEYECTFDQPSKRDGDKSSVYLRRLEARLRRAEAIVKVLAPDLDLNDSRLDNASPEEILMTLRQGSSHDTLYFSRTAPWPQHEAASVHTPNEATLETMMDNFGFLDRDERGYWDYHGHSSSTIFTQRLQNQFGNLIAPPRSSHMSRYKWRIPRVANPYITKQNGAKDTIIDTIFALSLPSKEAARELCRLCFDQGCSLARFIHEPSFWNKFDSIYTTSWDQFSEEEHIFLPQLYITLAVGCLFRDKNDSTTEIPSSEAAIKEGFQYFELCNNLVDVTDCRDLMTLQTIYLMVLFLQSSTKLSTCYAYIGIAQRAALRLGLHRSVEANFNAIERETRKRLFWSIRNTDVYVSTALGLPLQMSSDDVDQDYPLEIDDEYITSAGILYMPPSRTSPIAGVNAQSRLVDIVVKIVQNIYPTKPGTKPATSNHTYLIQCTMLREIEKDLKLWLEELPDELQLGTNTPPKLARIRQLLQLGYAHAQWLMYRPFLHYTSTDFQSQGIDKQSCQCAAACIRVSRNIVDITTHMYKCGFVNGAHWFTAHTTYYAILTLVFCLLENTILSESQNLVLRVTLEGKDTLAGLAKHSVAAARCACLQSLIDHLPEKLRPFQRSIAYLVADNTSQPLLYPTELEVERASFSPANSFNILPESHKSKDSLIRSSSFAIDRHLPAQSLLQAEQMETAEMVPDFMSLMFPSGDPFAYQSPLVLSLEDETFGAGFAEQSI